MECSITVMLSLCAMTVAEKVTYQTLLLVAVYMSSCARLTSSMDLLFHFGLVQRCLSVLDLLSYLHSRRTSLIAAVSCVLRIFTSFCYNFVYLICQLLPHPSVEPIAFGLKLHSRLRDLELQNRGVVLLLVLS